MPARKSSGKTSGSRGTNKGKQPPPAGNSARRAKAVDKVSCVEDIVANLKTVCENQARTNQDKMMTAAKLQVRKAYEAAGKCAAAASKAEDHVFKASFVGTQFLM